MLTLGHPHLQFSKANTCESPAQEGLLTFAAFHRGTALGVLLWGLALELQEGNGEVRKLSFVREIRGSVNG